jgi:Zn-dependent protease with chaperone function
MTDEQFESLVARLEAEQARHPAGYRRKVLLLAVAGYAYIALVLAGSTLLLLASLALITKAAAAGIKLAIVFGAFFWLVVRAMWVKLDPPAGREVSRAEAPELFALLDDLQRALQVSGGFDHVRISDDFNAAVVQIPRLGVLGWHRNYLLIGLPLMKALSREQFAAVLAHELGHLAGGHAALGNWVYRLRLGWAQLAARLQQAQSAAGFVFRPFFSRYVPYFSAVSFPLARANEYEADRNSARLTSPTAAAAALTTVNVLGNFLENRFWPDLHKQANDHAQPRFSPFAAMGGAMTGGVNESDLARWLSEALARRTSVADTHPALVDRLHALAEQARLALPQPGQAADLLLGPALAPITEAFDRHWQEAIRSAWEQRHQQVQEQRRSLAALDARAAAGELNFDERYQRALLTDEVGSGESAAREQLQALHAEDPEHAPVAYALGLRLLQVDDDAGIALVESAMVRDPEAIAPGAALLRDFHLRHGREVEAARWQQRWRERQELLYRAREERQQISAQDTFEAHGLSDAAVEALRRQLAGVPGLRKAWLVRKRVQHLPELPHLVLGFTATPWYLPRTAKRIRQTQDSIAEGVVFPGPAGVIGVEGGNAAIRRKMQKVAGGRLL